MWVWVCVRVHMHCSLSLLVCLLLSLYLTRQTAKSECVVMSMCFDFSHQQSVTSCVTNSEFSLFLLTSLQCWLLICCVSSKWSGVRLEWYHLLLCIFSNSCMSGILMFLVFDSLDTVFNLVYVCVVSLSAVWAERPRDRRMRRLLWWALTTAILLCRFALVHSSEITAAPPRANRPAARSECFIL